MAEPSRSAIAELDSEPMLADALELPNQLEDALWRADSAAIEAIEARGLVVCGIGGSAIGGDLAQAIVGGRATAPIATTRGFAPPPWTDAETMVLCASYSGETRETLECFERAGRLGAPRVVLTTGGRLAELAREAHVPVIGIPSGMQPRSAVAYMTVGALVAAERAGVAPVLREEVASAAQGLSTVAAEWGPAERGGEAGELAAWLHGFVAMICGAGAAAAPARRWKTQINENAEAPAFASDLPEAAHNEICSYAACGRVARALFLSDPARSEALGRQVEVAAERALAEGLEARTIPARGESPAERVLSLVLLGDLVSVYMAALAGVDPGPIPAIDRFKRELAET